MRYTSIMLLLLLIAAGCNGSGNNEGGEETAAQPQKTSSTGVFIAVVDINEVAREIGAMDKIRLAMADFELELKGQLADLKDRLAEEYEAAEQKWDGDLTETAQGELETMLARHQQQIDRQTAVANNQLANQHNQLKVKLLNQIRPVAYEVARERGMEMVLTTNQVYAAAPTADITEAVIARIQELNSATPEQPSSEESRVANLPGGGEFKPY